MNKVNVCHLLFTVTQIDNFAKSKNPYHSLVWRIFEACVHLCNGSFFSERNFIYSYMVGILKLNITSQNWYIGYKSKPRICDKVCSYWEQLREHIGYLMETCWDSYRTHWEHHNPKYPPNTQWLKHWAIEMHTTSSLGLASSPPHLKESCMNTYVPVNYSLYAHVKSMKNLNLL